MASVEFYVDLSEALIEGIKQGKTLDDFIKIVRSKNPGITTRHVMKALWMAVRFERVKLEVKA